MILTVSMKSEFRKEVQKTGINPNFEELLSNEDGVNSVDVFDNGRCARIDIEESALELLEDKFTQQFVFSPKIEFENFFEKN